jgi:lysozyme
MNDAFDMAMLVAELKRDEGTRLKPYTDTVGKLTIGVGRNLSDVGISDDECTILLQNDIERTVAALDRTLPWWRNLSPVRQRVLVNMAFNLGMVGLLTFKNTLGAMQNGSYAAAAAGMLSSKWATQVGVRAERLADMMRTGG